MDVHRHDKSHFFKYANCDTAIKIIESHSFRWSSPTLFNDPFDHQAGFVWPGDDHSFTAELAASLERMVFDEVETVLNGPRQLHKIVRQMRELNKRMPRREFGAVMNSAATAMRDAFKQMQPDFNRQILAYLSHSRVFCVTERNDNLVMWSHYGDEHKGVVFKLRCDVDIDNALVVASPVNYSDEFIPFPDSRSYAKYLTGESSLDFSPLVREIAYTKHTDWAYEREWRVHIPMLDWQAGDGYSYYIEKPSIFEAVYLGCRMLPADVSKVTTAIHTHLPDTTIFRARMNTTSFGLSFDEVR